MSVNFKITYSESPYPSGQTPGTAKIYYKKPGDADYTELIQTTTLPEKITVPRNTELKIELNHYGGNVPTGVARLILNDERIASTSASNKHVTQYITVVNNIEVRLSYARILQNRTECWVQCWMKPAPLYFEDFKAITIPEGNVKEISIGGQVVWKMKPAGFPITINNKGAMTTLQVNGVTAKAGDLVKPGDEIYVVGYLKPSGEYGYMYLNGAEVDRTRYGSVAHRWTLTAEDTKLDIYAPESSGYNPSIYIHTK